MKKQMGCFLFIFCSCIIIFNCTNPDEGFCQQQAGSASDESGLYPVNAINEVIGHWSFVYFKKYRYIVGQLPAPPNFDAIEFIMPNSIKLISVLNNAAFSGSFKVSAGLITYMIQAPGKESPVVQKMGCFLANEGKAMVLLSDETEFVFFRTNRILKNDIAGKWRTELGGKKEVMELGEDGSYAFGTIPVTGIYRLWPSRFGQAITEIYKVPQSGAFTAIYSYEYIDNQLIFKPIELSEIPPDKTIIWKRE